MDTTGPVQRGLTSTRRDALKTFGVAGVASVLGGSAWAQGTTPAVTGTPPNVLTNPPRQWGPDAPPAKYPDDDIITISDDFRPALLGITQIRRIWTGANWAEGPAWCAQGQYLVFSDVQASIQYSTSRAARFRRRTFSAASCAGSMTVR
jgi:gluconolactonase